MEIQDGFIVGIYNYCDRWCETCAFTSRCRQFADRLEFEASRDPNLRPLAEAPPLPHETPPAPPPWLQELLEDMNEAARQPPTKEELDDLMPKVLPEHVPIEARARRYGFRAHDWLESRGFNNSTDPSDPRTVIGWFSFYISPKVYRALTGLSSGWPHLDAAPDHDGSAKAALVAIDRSHAAWLGLVERKLATMADVATFVEDLVWLGEALERVFPDARAFIRPGFDEPEEVSRLER